ncbi:MAG TPA: TetR family transcriptional regulator [Acidimicrobiia bacterium]|jgi:AcrR family transcriptional regulator
MTAVPAATARGRRTRDALLDATVELVSERGFHAVGIAEIGAAAGVSGAAIYRHYRNKNELLVAVFERVVDELLDGARAVLAEPGLDPAARLAALIDAHVTFALAQRRVIAIYDQEAHNLPPEHRRRVRRQQGAYAALWVDALGAFRSDWTAAECRVAVHAVFGLINSVSDQRVSVSRERQTTLLRTMALATLTAA